VSKNAFGVFQGFGSGSAFKLLFWILIQEGKKLPTEIEKKVHNFHVFKYWMFSFEG
jgi:hypothetical protein